MHSSVFAMACALAAVIASHSAHAESLLIPADKIYASPEAAPLSNGNILIRAGKIASVADERSRIAIPEGTQTSECRGVVVAGFQNSHVHLLGPLFDGAASRPAHELEQGVESMLTRYGFTTVFDTGSDIANTVALRARIEKGEIRGPRILTAGWPIYPLDGIPFYLKDLPKHVLDQLYQPKSAADARADAAENLARGADGTKIFMVTSPSRNVERVLAPDVARAVARQTHARGKLLLAHPTNVAGVRAALEAGVDVIVHTTLGETTAWDEALTREMVQKKMSVIPTFKLWSYELAKQNVPPEVVERLVGATLAELRNFVKAGGQVLFGTDVGYMHEFDPTDEYVLMGKAGLTPAQILRSLTTAPAQRWKEGRRRGRVETGFDADLVVLAADPFEDVKNFAQVRCVFRGGTQVYPLAAR
jgi:imidazolonepropionase-like amidohydrolase